ncbi:MAG: hypothetical protein ACHQQR_13345, partial [Gemmatimonadales bacterium]
MTSLHEMMRTIRRAVRAAIAQRAAHGPRPGRFERPSRARRLARTHPDDEPIAMQLQEFHRRLNAERFDAKLQAIAVRVSRRMRSR